MQDFDDRYYANEGLESEYPTECRSKAPQPNHNSHIIFSLKRRKLDATFDAYQFIF